MLHNDIMGSDIHTPMSLYGYAWLGRGLAGDGDIWIANDEGILEQNRPGNTEDYDSRFFPFDGLAERSRTGVVEIADDDNLPSSASDAAGAMTDDPRISRLRRRMTGAG